MATRKNTKSIKTGKTGKRTQTVAKTARKSAKPAASAASTSKPMLAPPVAKKTAASAVAAAKTASKTARFNDKDLQAFRKELLVLRDRLTGQVARMRQDSLKRDDEVNPEEDGTDAFDRLFALERAGSDQDRIFTIDESIRAIDEGKYGICDGCTNLIEKPRLHALPFAKNCIKCQSEMERGRNNGRSRRQVP